MQKVIPLSIQTVQACNLPEPISLTEGFPSELHCLGNAAALQHPLVAIVGTRNPTTYGLRACTYFARELTVRGYGIVSGLAVGIDAAAHRACLQEGGVTVAVVAHGLDQLYPAENRGLATEILQKGGALVSEFTVGTPPVRSNFPRRNRIISALGMVTLIVEASARSGSLITAHCAVNQGREVLVVPGPFQAASFVGSHSLIREGAKLVDTIEEVLNELRVVSLPHISPAKISTQWEEQAYWREVFAELGNRATLLDLMDKTGRKMEAILSAMQRGFEAHQIECIGLQTWIWMT